MRVCVKVNGKWRKATPNQYKAYLARYTTKRAGGWKILGKPGRWIVQSLNGKESYQIRNIEASTPRGGTSTASAWSKSRAEAFIAACTRKGEAVWGKKLPHAQQEPCVIEYLTTGGKLRDEANYQHVAIWYEGNVTDYGIYEFWMDDPSKPGEKLKFCNSCGDNYKKYPAVAMEMFAKAEASVKAGDGGSRRRPTHGGGGKRRRLTHGYACAFADA